MDEEENVEYMTLFRFKVPGLKVLMFDITLFRWALARHSRKVGDGS